MIRKTSFGARRAITITRVFGKMGLSLGLLLGFLGILQPAAAQSSLPVEAALLTPAAVGDSLERARSEGFTKVSYGGHRGHRRGYAKGGHGFRDHRFGGRRFGRRSFFGYGHRFGGHRFGRRRFFGHGYRFGGYGFGKRGHQRYH